MNNQIYLDQEAYIKNVILRFLAAYQHTDVLISYTYDSKCLFMSNALANIVVDDADTFNLGEVYSESEVDLLEKYQRPIGFGGEVVSRVYRFGTQYYLGSILPAYTDNHENVGEITFLKPILLNLIIDLIAGYLRNKMYLGEDFFKLLELAKPGNKYSEMLKDQNYNLTKLQKMILFMLNAGFTQRETAYIIGFSRSNITKNVMQLAHIFGVSGYNVRELFSKMYKENLQYSIVDAVFDLIKNRKKSG